MFHKKKGFTLVELIVSISIMSIVLILAIPSIGAITERNSKKRYQNYAETLLSSAKLYTDSYNIDMFGYEKDGCYQINFSQMEEKKLAKDIDYKEVTCADREQKKTYVLVKKLDGNIKYQLSIRCVDESNKEEVYRELIDEESAICAGTKSYEGPKISVSPESTNGYLSENETYKVSITVSDVDGLLENNEVEYFWCSDSNCNNVVTSGRIKYENKRETPSASRKVKRPKGDGVYYLKVRPVKVVDVFNNGTTQETKVYGQYKFDTTPPVVTVVAYRRSGSGLKEGTAVGQATLGTKQLLADKKYKITGSLGSNYSNNYSGWLNKTNYPNGIYYEITYNDNVEVETESWKENKTGHKSATAAAKVLDGRTGSRNLKSKSGTVGEYFKDDGYRKGQILVTDIAGNYVTVDLDAYLDLTLPGCSSGGGNDAWLNASSNPGYRRITGTCTDGMSSCTTTTIYTDYSTDMNELKGPGTVSDKAGNSVGCPVNQRVRIDKTAPTCASSGGTGWINGTATLVGTCYDNLSGCTGNISRTISSEGVFTNQSPGAVYDYAGNGVGCPANQNVYIDKTPPSCSFGQQKAGEKGISFRIKCRDSGGSGITRCDGEYYADGKSSKNVDKSEIKKSKNYTVTDGAGNSNTCSINVNHGPNATYCGTHDCNPYNCNPYSCNPYECNCQHKTAQSCTGGWVDTGQIFDNAYKDCKKCSTCYQTCYHTCYQQCANTCYYP